MTLVAASSPLKKLLFSEVIKWYQGNTEYSHVLIVKSDIVYQSNRHGAHKIPLDEFLRSNKIVFKMTIDDSMIDWDFVNESVEKDVPYGYAQIAFIAIRKLFRIIITWKTESMLVCSEFVGKALRLKWVDEFTDPKDIVDYLKKQGCKDVSHVRSI